MEYNQFPLKKDDGYDWTEDFDGFINTNNKKYYLNLKMVCDNGGAQTRTLREVNHFIRCQMNNLMTNNSENIYFINILDGDTSHKSMRYFNNTLNEFETYKKYVFVGDMYDFDIWWNSQYSS